MSDAVSALDGATWSDGIAAVQELGLQGMITLRADLSAAAIKKAIKSATKAEIPARGSVTSSGDISLCWMSPDELLILCPHDAAPELTAELQGALGKTHALVVDVSDARAVFRVSGTHARDVMAKLAPVDFSPGAFPVGHFRRSRLAQVAAAFRTVDTDTFEIICFRSSAQYMYDLLKTAAQPGSEVGFF